MKLLQSLNEAQEEGLGFGVEYLGHLHGIMQSWYIHEIFHVRFPHSNQATPSHHRQARFPAWLDKPKTAFAHFKSCRKFDILEVQFF